MVIVMNYTQNQKIYESTSLDIINWSEIDRSKTNKYVIKQKRQIYNAECNNNHEIVVIFG